MSHTIKRLLALLSVRVASILDRRVDSIVAGLVKLDAKLEAHIVAQNRVSEQTSKVAQASIQRQLKTAAAEYGLREAAYQREDAAHQEAKRAIRIRERISALVE